MPAGGILISPWSDMTHSFPSIHTNTDTDVLPYWGLSLMKPSILWPPPTDEETRRAHNSLRSRIRQAITHRTPTPRASVSTMRSTQSRSSANHPLPIDIGSTISVPSLNNETIRLVTEGGETLTIDKQIQLYTQNSLLAHPLVSPALSYLGGLPPLLVIAGNGEVLRDEIVYTAHKAANPAQYAVHPTAQELYPPLREIEGKHSPTKVHLQIYDDAAHVLPVLFAFSTPAKYCFRAMATFCKHVMEVGYDPPTPPATSKSMPNMPSNPLGNGIDAALNGAELRAVQSAPSHDLKKSRSIRRSISVKMQRAAHAMQPWNKRQQQVDSSLPILPEAQASEQKPALRSRSPSDVAGPRFGARSSEEPRDAERYAGEPTAYLTQGNEYPWAGPMIRERVSTRGVLRPLEPESDIIACSMPPDVVGLLSERAIRRYLESAMIFDKKFARHAKAIERQRRQNLKRAEKQTTKSLEAYKDLAARRNNGTNRLEPTSMNKSWAWALDVHEKPPPSSIVARRDTKEASELAKSADRSILEGEQTLSANNFWTLLVNFFTVIPERHPVAKENSP
ncbi:hypothetical protein AX14_014142 [Amanita brunnescens Koide BX004]|nr:hypothetical protein AX14_014142 [Amanita brunnescens Koide BX004]